MKLRFRTRFCSRSGQALIEFTCVVFILLLLVFGLIDFCREISIRHVITSLTREGSNLASRNTSLASALDAVVKSADPLNITNNGHIIISVVTNNAGQAWVADQAIWPNTAVTNSTKSKVGVPGAAALSGWIPTTLPPLPESNQTIYVTEVYYSFHAATPVGKLLNFNLPTWMYDAAYF